MRSKKLILNVLSILSVVMMTTVMVLSSCTNALDSEHANITIRLGRSGSGRAISAEENPPPLSTCILMIRLSLQM